MLCQECRKNPATVHIEQQINEHRAELHLCEACARDKKAELHIVEPKLAIQNFLAGLMESGNPFPGTSVTAVRCQACGMTFADFSRSGRLGCGNCYAQFSQGIDPLLRRIHGSQQHTGKIARRGHGKLRVRREMGKIREQLAEAIRREEFELAAKLRDRLRELEKDLV